MKLKIKITYEVLTTTRMCGIDDFMLEDSENCGNSRNCAITYACRKLFTGCVTGGDAIYLESGDTIANLPKIASDFIKRFDKATSDERVNIKPFEFEIELTKEALDLITIDEITKVLETSTTLEAVQILGWASY